VARVPEPATPIELLEGRTKPDIVNVPQRLVLTLSGASAPDSEEFAEAVGALYGVAYTLRFARKKAGRDPFKVGTLEGEWWAEGDDLPTDRVPDRSAWRWSLRSAVPSDTTEEEVAEAVEQAVTRKGGKLEGSDVALEVRLVSLPSETMARILHRGPYDAEAESFRVMDAYLSEQGLERRPGHLEVYLSDPSRTSRDKLRTVLLAAVAPSG
jgi:hypothetical protein